MGDGVEVRTVVVAGYFGAGNFGDELLLRLLLRELPPDWQPVVITREPSRTSATHGVVTVGRSSREIRSVMKAADRLIIGPGGLFHNVAGPLPGDRHAGLAEVAGWARAARECAVPYALFGVSFGPFRGNSARRATFEIAASADFVAVRDEAGAAMLGEQGISCIIMADLSFLLARNSQPPAQGTLIVERPWGTHHPISLLDLTGLPGPVTVATTQPGDRLDGEPALSIDAATAWPDVVITMR
ncbi:MAG: polysaccharide pyruvyl transferase family protein, partial [Acidimicrobiia bacterium]|nr:polysaccharide pyruvyl transferase family protein [Acidimicrobiia bacterium]